MGLRREPRALRARIGCLADCVRAARQRVRHFVAKSRHVVAPACPSCLIFSHCVAQTRMRVRGARGSDGGGTEVSSGGSSGSGAGADGVSPGGGCGACGRRGGKGACGGKGARAPRRAAGALVSLCSPRAWRDGASSGAATAETTKQATQQHRRRMPADARLGMRGSGARCRSTGSWRNCEPPLS